MTRRIRITQEIIDQSMRANSSHCMIADAVRAAVPEATYVQVDLQTIRFSTEISRFVYFTPRAAQLALVKFDQGENDIKPFDFALGRPTQIVERGRDVDKASKPAPSPTKSASAAKGGKKTQAKARLARSTTQKIGATKVGGQLPPTFTVQSNLGNRRVFGLRAARA